jgi:hypothetical protein
MNRPGPVVSRVPNSLAIASPPKYRLKVALPARIPQDAAVGIVFWLVSNREEPQEAEAPE